MTLRWTSGMSLYSPSQRKWLLVAEDHKLANYHNWMLYASGRSIILDLEEAKLDRSYRLCNNLSSAAEGMDQLKRSCCLKLEETQALLTMLVGRISSVAACLYPDTTEAGR